MADVTSCLFLSIYLSQEKPFENGWIWLLECQQKLSFMSLFSGALFEFNQTKITVDEGYDATLIFYVFKYRDIDLGAETWDQALFSFRRARRNEKRAWYKPLTKCLPPTFLIDWHLPNQPIRITSVACFSSMQIFHAWEKCRLADLKNSFYL